MSFLKIKTSTRFFVGGLTSWDGQSWVDSDKVIQWNIVQFTLNPFILSNILFNYFNIGSWRITRIVRHCDLKIYINFISIAKWIIKHWHLAKYASWKVTGWAVNQIRWQIDTQLRYSWWNKHDSVGFTVTFFNCFFLIPTNYFKIYFQVEFNLLI